MRITTSDQDRVKKQILTDIYTVIGLPIQWFFTGFGTIMAWIALVEEHKKARLSTDIGPVSIDDVVGYDTRKTVDVISFSDKHNLYYSGNAPLAKTAVTILHALNIGADEAMVMEIFGQYGFTVPTEVLPVKQIMHHLGVVTKTIKVKRGRGRGHKTKTVIMVKTSRHNIITKIANIGNTGVIVRPTTVISMPLYTVGTETTKAEQVSTGDFYATIERVFIGDYLVNVGVTNRRPQASYSRSKPIPLNIVTPYLTLTCKQAKTGVAKAIQFGVTDVKDFTDQVVDSADGVKMAYVTVATTVCFMNREHSKAAAKGYEIIEGKGTIVEKAIALEPVISVADDDVVTEPVKELVHAGPSVVDQGLGLPQASWTPSSN